MLGGSGDSGLFRLEAIAPGSAPVPRRPSVAAGRRGAGVWAFLLALLTAGALAHVGVRLKNLEIAYELGRERRVTSQLEERKRQLQIEIGMLKDPGRVISLARDKLRMAPPTPEAIRRLDSLQALPATTATTATAAAPSASVNTSARAAVKSTGKKPGANSERKSERKSGAQPTTKPARPSEEADD